jgi:hypothetical protein
MIKRFLVSNILAIVLSVSIFWPVGAETEISRELDAALIGITEFSPGDEGILQIAIQNNNTPDKISTTAFQSGLSSYFGSAVSLSALLENQSAPISIKSGKILVGTLPAGTVTPALPFNIEVNDNASPGEYQIRLTLDYRIIESTSGDSDGIETEWTDRTDIKDLSLTIKDSEKSEEQLDFKISRVDADKFAPGGTGVLQICVQNNETVNQIDASALQSNLSQNYGSAVSLVAHIDPLESPLTIETGDILLGTLPAGQATPALPVAVEIDEEAVPGLYQMKVTVDYKTLKSISTKEGSPHLEWSSGSSDQLINIEVKEKVLNFEITKVESDLKAGAKDQILVTFKNLGSEKALDATARISAAFPITLTDNTAFLGSLEPGQSATGTFGIKAAGDAISKEYTLDALVQYTNSKDESLISDTVKVPVYVGKTSYPVSVVRNEWLSALVGAAIVGLIWVVAIVWRSRRKRI